MRKVWIIGHIAEDLVLMLNEQLNVGKFHLPGKIIERCGGSTSNIAIALASGPIDTGFVTYLGRDATAERLEPYLHAANFSDLHITRGNDQTPRCLVVVDSSGERTLMLLTIPPKNLGGITFKSVSIHPDDIIVFTHWYEEWREEIEYVKRLGCTVIVGIGALLVQPDISADIAIGSLSDLPKELDFEKYLENFPIIVVTRGTSGSTLYSKDGVIHQDAFKVKTVDTTGAGDAFLAGFLTGYALELTDRKVALELGAKWAAAMVEIEASIPPNFFSVPGLSELIKVEQK